MARLYSAGAGRKLVAGGGAGGLPALGNVRDRDRFTGVNPMFGTLRGAQGRQTALAVAHGAGPARIAGRFDPFGGGGGFDPTFGGAGVGRAPAPRTYQNFSMSGGDVMAASRFREALELSPEAYRLLDPNIAAQMQVSSDIGARDRAVGRAEEALATVSAELEQTGTVGQEALENLAKFAQGGGDGAELPPVPTPPDIGAMMGKPGYDEAHWQRRQQKSMGEVSRKFAMRREMLRRRGRTMSQSVYQNELKELEEDEQQAGLQAIAQLESERDETEERGRMARVDRISSLYGTYAPLETGRARAEAELGLRGQELGLRGLTSAAEIGTRADISGAGQELSRRGMVADLLTRGWPETAENWTGIEQYLSGARYAEEAAGIGRRMAGARVPGGGGGFSGGATGVSAFQTAGAGGIIARPRGRMRVPARLTPEQEAAQWFEGGGGGLPDRGGEFYEQVPRMIPAQRRRFEEDWAVGY